MRTITPTIDENVKIFCNKYLNKNELFYVDVIPDKDAEPNNCFYNVDDVIKKYGGCKIYGWVIWKWPNILIEGEAHAIWKREDGKYIDVTPHEYNINNILFVPDKYMIYEDTIIKSKRMQLTNSSEEQLKLISQFNTVVKRNELCPCNSRLKYKKCCGSNM